MSIIGVQKIGPRKQTHDLTAPKSIIFVSTSLNTGDEAEETIRCIKSDSLKFIPSRLDILVLILFSL